MTTATLKDSIPTTTITFFLFSEVDRRIEAKYFSPQAYPENEGREIIFQGAWLRVFKFDFTLKDDDTYPASGDSCADKYEEFENLLLTGGDNDWKFTVTFDLEDSTVGTPQTKSIDGFVKMLRKRTIYGKHVNHVEGEFEFWESNV